MRRIVYPPFWRKVASVEGREHLPTSGGFVLAANHVDWLDGFYLAAAVDRTRNIPLYFLTKSRNYWWTTIALPIPEERESIIATAVTYLRRGRSICNFPEGRRNPTDRMLSGKTGTVRMAIEANVPVVPVGIACEAGENMTQSLRFLLSASHPVRLRFGPALRYTAPATVTEKYLYQATAELIRSIATLADKTV